MARLMAFIRSGGRGFIVWLDGSCPQKAQSEEKKWYRHENKNVAANPKLAMKPLDDGIPRRRPFTPLGVIVPNIGKQ